MSMHQHTTALPAGRRKRTFLSPLTRKQIKANWLLYLFLLPAVAYIVVFHYAPLYGIQIAFKEFDPVLGITGSPWVGMKYFSRFFSSPRFSQILTNTVSLSVYGLVAGFPVLMVLKNLIPIVIIAALIALGLWKAEGAMVRGFGYFGKGVTAVITVGLAAAIVESLTGWVLIPGMEPLSTGFETVGAIAIVLAGAFPLVFSVTKLLRRPLEKLGKLLGINDAAAGGLVATLANSIATFGMVKDMDPRGKVVNIAFAVSAAFVFGDHLGFTAGFAPELLPAMIAGKLAGGVTAAALALLLTKKN